MPNLSLQPISVATGEDEEGRLVLVDDRLMAVLVRLSRQHGPLAGYWFLEASFGPALDAITWPTFPGLKAANEGAVFASWYGQASCTAGRASFMAGQIPVRSALSIVVAPSGEPALPSTGSLTR